MKHQVIYRSNWAIPTSLLIIFALVGCQPPAPTQAPPAALATSTSGATSTPAPASSTPPASSPAPASPTVGVPKGNLPPDVLYQDDFTNPATNWAAAESPDFFVGYHEPQYYHIEIRSPHYKAPVISIPDPEKHNYPDATIELQVFTVAGKTAPEGDFRYGLVFRRSGDNYYAFTISPRTKAWSVFKSSPNGIVPLKDGTDDSIHDLDGTDTLRVDAQGPDFSFEINDRQVGQVTDPDYPTGEIGLYAETIDSTRVHIHFDTLTIRKFQLPDQKPPLYQDDFTNPATNWTAAESPDFFVGYHEPQYYHIEIRSPHYKAPVISIPDPEKHNYPDATIELQVFTVAGKTAPEGDFRYGLVFRRSGDNYYAFTISPRTKAWSVFKSSPNGIVPLKDGTDDSIHDLDGTDTLRVDAQGPNFLFHINDRLIDQVVDPDYPTGEIGLYAETIDSTRVHIHFDTLTIREVDFSLACKITNGGMFNVRTGPGKTSASVAVVSDGDTLAPTGVSTDREWIQIKLEGSNNLGWVSYSPGYMSCTPSIDLFPIVSP